MPYNLPAMRGGANIAPTAADRIAAERNSWPVTDPEFISVSSFAVSSGDAERRMRPTRHDLALLEQLSAAIKRLHLVTESVSQGHLANLAAAGVPEETTVGDDQAIRTQLLTELNSREWAKVWAADIIVKDGVVNLWVGAERSPDELKALRVAAEMSPGSRKSRSI